MGLRMMIASRATLELIVDQWAEIEIASHESEQGALLGKDCHFVADMNAKYRSWILSQAKKVCAAIDLFLQDNTDKSAEEMEDIAGQVSPGGAHTGGLLVNLIRQHVFGADPILIAATIYHNWHGGKAGFQFLPDPAATDPEDYETEAFDLIETLDAGIWGDPSRILTGDDRRFYDSLPDRFTVYRGCAGVSPEVGALGVCWTTQRDIAEWFADRSSRERSQRVVLSARARKEDVRLAKASEFEVVLMPRSARVLKPSKSTNIRRPNMEWQPTVAMDPLVHQGAAL